MWGAFIKNAAALATDAQSIVGRVDEIASQGLSSASQFLERLDGLGNAEGEEIGEDREENSVEDKQKSDVVANEVQGSLSTSVSVYSDRSSGSSLNPLPLSGSLHTATHFEDDFSSAIPNIETTLSAHSKSTIEQTKKNPVEVKQSSYPSSKPSLSATTPQTAEIDTPQPKTDSKKYQRLIRKLEKEKTQLEEDTSNLQLSVATLSKELQAAVISVNSSQQERFQLESERELLKNDLTQQKLQMQIAYDSYEHQLNELKAALQVVSQQAEHHNTEATNQVQEIQVENEKIKLARDILAQEKVSSRFLLKCY